LFLPLPDLSPIMSGTTDARQEAATSRIADQPV
jgi:hypothetical protein